MVSTVALVVAVLGLGVLIGGALYLWLRRRRRGRAGDD
jgi:LPXTG-motif cell wall-anchored protein